MQLPVATEGAIQMPNFVPNLKVYQGYYFIKQLFANQNITHITHLEAHACGVLSVCTHTRPLGGETPPQN